MPLTASEVAAFKATDKRQNKSCGDSLVLVVEPISNGGGEDTAQDPENNDHCSLFSTSLI